MRLSQTRQRGRRRVNLACRGSCAHQERQGQRAVLWQMSLSLGLLALVVAGIAGVFGLGRHLVTRADVPAPNPNCTLILPPHPLSAQGLATPFQLTATNPAQGPCHEANATAQAAFVQGAIFDPATSRISIYDPLVIDQGTMPAIKPVVPDLPAGAIVALWFGFNGTNLTLRGSAPGELAQAHCVNGLLTSLFTQVAYCNAVAFFRAADAAIAAGTLHIPSPGVGRDGFPCPTVRSFRVVDQDQSDNDTTSYLVTPGGQIAQNTAANRARLPHATVINNGSDNFVLTDFMDPALGCTPYRAPDLADPGHLTTALPLDELQAMVYQAPPVALVPSTDPMVTVDGQPNVLKQDLYRAGVDQPPIMSPAAAAAQDRAYCQRLLTIGPVSIFGDKPFFAAFPSPFPNMASNLFTFLAARWVTTWGANGGMNCVGILHQPSPIVLQTDANGVVIGATLRRTDNHGRQGDQQGADRGRPDGQGSTSSNQNHQSVPGQSQGAPGSTATQQSHDGQSGAPSGQDHGTQDSVGTGQGQSLPGGGSALPPGTPGGTPAAGPDQGSQSVLPACPASNATGQGCAGTLSTSDPQG
jgi:hypothetical protein